MLEQQSSARLEQLQRDAYDRIAAMPTDEHGGLPLRLEALFALGRI
jgi:hypothetical protein